MLGDCASHADEYAVQAIGFCMRYNNAARDSGSGEVGQK